MLEMRVNNLTAMIFLAVLLLCIAVGATRCAKIARGDDLPPLYIDYFIPYISKDKADG